jgi:23S rRNA (guanosine2251-2'-O)-methyltransferase
MNDRPHRDKRPKRFGRPPQAGGHRQFRPRTPAERRAEDLWIYGMHPALAALANPRRVVKRALVTANALRRLEEAGGRLPVAPEEKTPRDLDKLLGSEAVHQGIALEVEPLPALDIAELRQARLVVVLDQITDPHNVGAVLRSATAFGADAVMTTGRHAPVESGVLAKAASGAADLLPIIEVRNLARGMEELRGLGFTLIGLDSEGDRAIGDAWSGNRIALVLGAEGKGLRRLTRDTCDVVARLDAPGPIKSLNVSNAAAISLYLAARHLAGIAAPPPSGGN